MYTEFGHTFHKKITFVICLINFSIRQGLWNPLLLYYYMTD